MAHMGHMKPGASEAVFGVTRSVLGQAWRRRVSGPRASDQGTDDQRAGDQRAATAIAQALDAPDIVGRILCTRAVTAPEAVDFLNPSLRQLLPDPSTLVDMDKAASRLADAVEGGETVAIFSDYDVDGATSAAVLSLYLAALGRQPIVYVPDRVAEGYGPNAAALRQLADQGASLIVTLDCGIAAHAAFAEFGGAADIIVLDHHQASEELPQALALVNPNRLDDLSGLGHLAAVGVTFMGVVALTRELRARGFFASGRPEPDLFDLVGLVALGTVCDVVPLVGLNRAFVTRGLEILRRRENPGLDTLCDVARLSEPVNAYHLGYLLGPRINAGGRIGKSDLGYRLLTCSDADQALPLALELDQLNQERRAMEAQATQAAVEQVEAAWQENGETETITVANTAWHPGIVGLVAARIKERFRRPAFAIGTDNDGLGKGSGRSIRGVDLGAAVRAAVKRGLVLGGGGHAMAAGLSVEFDQIPALAAFLETSLGQTAQTARAADFLAIDGPLSAGGANLELMEWLTRIGPFGAGHPEPRFAFPAHRVRYAKQVGDSHIRLTLEGGDKRRIEAIAFRATQSPLGELLLAGRELPIHVAGKLKVNTWSGTRKVQLVIDDAAMPHR
ncbi:MAG: single-stranded-DNA-specific exonuclease RecJ [Alphaproteobacteria bacterium]